MKDEPLILAIETATRAGGVAVARGQDILASITGDPAVSHSSNLIEMIESVLQAGGIALHEVDLFAVAVGPNVRQPAVALLAIILAGAAFGFLPQNFYPAEE